MTDARWIDALHRAPCQAGCGPDGAMIPAAVTATFPTSTFLKARPWDGLCTRNGL